MANDQNLVTVTKTAENDLSAKQYYIVELSAENQVDVCDGATDLPYGVLQNDPDVGQAATVAIGGKTKVVSDGSGVNITVGSWLGTDGSGKAVVKSTDGDLVLGIAEQASTADGTIIEMTIRPFQLAS